VNCAQCGAPVNPGQVCNSCGTLAPYGAPAESPAASATWPTPPGSGQGPYGEAPGASQAPYGAPQPGGSPYGGLPLAPPVPPMGSYQPYGAVQAAGAKTNGFAIAGLICSIAGVLCGVGSILGIIFGFVARSQINRSGGVQGGKGMATAAIIIGFILLGVGIIATVILLTAHTATTGG